MNAPYLPKNSIFAKISRRTTSLQARRIIRYRLKRPIISFTFDDFPRSCIANGARLLERENWRATFYVSASLEGISNHHGKNFLAEDLLKLQKAGHEIACHTFSHIDCTTASIEDILADIDKNKTALAKMGIGRPEHFAWPFGELDARSKRELAKRFKTMRGIKTGAQFDKADLNQIKSYGIYSDNSLEKLLADIEALAFRPGWITVFAHDIRKAPSKWGCTPEDFARLVGIVKDIDALVLPIGAAIDYLEQHND